MAYSVNGTTITVTRGDTVDIQLDIYDGESAYVPETGDAIRFAMKHDRLNVSGTDYADTSPLLTVVIDPTDPVLHLDPADTKTLGFGKYVYDIELTHADDSVDTFITASVFVIAPEVH